MHTEAEARELWCPFARVRSVPSGTSLAHNRVDGGEDWPDGTSALVDNPRGARCLGSRCMAWRWAYRSPPGNTTSAVAVSQPTGEGYCGLAGQSLL